MTLRRLILPLSTLLCACSPSAVPAWALDPVWLEPNGKEVYGFQTWQVYSEKWREHPDDRYFLCAVVVELSGTPAGAPCPECAVSWDLQTALLETDCAPDTSSDPLFLSLRSIGIGPIADTQDAEHPGLTSSAHADYGYGWEPYGHGYPAVLDAGETLETGAWDGVQPFALWPDAIWPTGPTGGGDTLTRVSRAGPR